MGLMGTLVPFIPGIPLILISAIILAAVDNFNKISIPSLLIMGGFTICSYFLDAALIARGIKKTGGSRRGLAGSALGAIIGFVIGNLPGMVVGLFLGLVVGEILSGARPKQIPNIAMGAIWGFFASALMQFALALIMVGIIIYAYFR